MATFMALSAAAGALEACSCVVLSSRCDTAWNSGNMVFLGKVSSISGGEREPQKDGSYRLSDYEVHFAAVEMLRGPDSPSQELVVYTGFGGGDCGYPFVVGTSYLVYAFDQGGRLSASTCSETAPEMAAAGALRELRALRKGTRADDLFGTLGVLSGFGWQDAAKTRPLAHVPVQAIARSGRRFSSTTDEHGVYDFPALPAADYRIQASLPPGLTKDETQSANTFGVRVKHAKGHEAGCRADIFRRPDGEITGQVVDQSGNGLPGFVSLEWADRAETDPNRGEGLAGDETSNGHFSLAPLPPGRFRLAFRLEDERFPLPKVFYWTPASGDSHSGGLDLGFGQHLDNVRFAVPLGSDRRGVKR